ncbi:MULTISPECIES: acyl carrier protein [Micromonospora]|uniref:Acyl carrier protein n=1 Tax=Micromonospora haikouensis TaxID=686309 RepID=A0A0D0W0F6_9ACTN|nr:MULTISPECIES: acyl carrier protein [Micromonospora]KIR66318.1 hypothetical protein TK50_14345 [Micromonospora haikouensis]OON30611.1 hypothetical protein BSA16_15230 [Micromonospora sp. Rc5]
MTLDDELYDDVTTLLANHCAVDPARVGPTTQLFDELGLDSLDLIGMAQALQSKYSVALDNEGIAEIRTVGDVVAFVRRRMSDRVAGAGAGESTVLER